MKQFILALCGLPASGKSTLADAICKELNFEVDIVRTDEWRTDTYYTDWKPEKEEHVRKVALARVIQLVEQGKNVIHDDTNYYTSMRHELFKVALENKCIFAIIHVSTPVETALKWNEERLESKIPDSVIEGINERFDLPGRRYLWDDAILEVNMGFPNLDKIIPEIVECLEELEPVTKSKPRLVTSNEFERLDIETRRIVSKFLEEYPELRGHREVSKIRRSFLRTATERRIPLKSVNKLLHEKLSRLL